MRIGADGDVGVVGRRGVDAQGVALLVVDGQGDAHDIAARVEYGGEDIAAVVVGEVAPAAVKTDDESPSAAGVADGEARCVSAWV